MVSRSSHALRREDFAKRIADFSAQERVRSVLKSAQENLDADSASGDFKSFTIKNDGTGPATVEYLTEDGTGVIGKLFWNDSGRHSYDMLRHLWNGGFNKTQRYRVPEPIGFFEEFNAVLMRATEGRSLAEILEENSSEALAGVKEAARWLVRLHDSVVRFGKTDEPWYLFRKLASRLTKAASAHPDLVKVLTGMVTRFGDVAESRQPVELVQTHGQYRPMHVFLEGTAVTAIDLDRSVPSDPARDLGEFVHKLRTGVFRVESDVVCARERADAITRAFLSEYSLGRPTAVVNLPFYHGFNVLVAYSKHLRRMNRNEPRWLSTVEHYNTEFEEALEF